MATIFLVTASLQSLLCLGGLLFFSLCFPLLSLGLGLSGWLSSKESIYSVGDVGSIPGLIRSPGEGNGNPFQYSFLGNPMVRGPWWATVHRVTKSQKWLSNWTTTIWDLRTMWIVKDGEALYSQQKQDRELNVAQITRQLLTAKFKLKLKKMEKTTRPFRYNLNQIPYTVEVRNKFKGLDLIECPMKYGRRFVTLYRRQESRPSPRKRNAKKQKGSLRRPYK